LENINSAEPNLEIAAQMSSSDNSSPQETYVSCNRNFFDRWCFVLILESLLDKLVFVTFVDSNRDFQLSELMAHFLQLPQVGAEHRNIALIVVHPLAQEVHDQIDDHFDLVSAEFEGVANLHIAETHLKCVDLGNRLLATIFLVVMGEEHNVLTHSPHVWVAQHDLVVLQLRVQDRSKKEDLGDDISLAGRSSYLMCWEIVGRMRR
jgi:hypothetical protein